MPTYNKKNYRRRQGKKSYKNSGKKGKSKVEVPQDRKRKNLKFIQRSKEAENFQRRQKAFEDEYKRKAISKTVNGDQVEITFNEVKEEDPYECLLATFKKENTYNVLIESSSDEAEVDSENECDDKGENESEDEDEGEVEDDEQDIDEEECDPENENQEDSESDTSLEIEKFPGQDSKCENVIMEEELDDEIENVEKNCEIALPTDPFSLHLDYELSDEHLNNLTTKPCVSTTTKLIWPEIGVLNVEISKSTEEKPKEGESPEKKKKCLLSDEKRHASEGSNPILLNSSNVELLSAGIKEQLVKNMSFFKRKKLYTPTDQILTQFQTELFSIFNNYQDLFYSQRSLKNAEEIRLVYCLHALNHMMKTRARVLHHNAKLNAASLKKKLDAIMPESFRDQGLVRPKILIMVPFRDSAYKVVNTLIGLLYGEKSEKAKNDGNVINYKRFEEEYTGNSIYFPKTNPKPEDYEMTFTGNTDDSFRIGISLTKKSIKLYTEFYSSDILIASPVSLRMIIGAEGDAERDYDFLASIELLVLDQMEIFYAQNWDHLIHVMDHLHLQPQSVHNTDISRVRSWSIAGQARFYRQTLLFSSHELPEFRSIFNNKCSNYRGKIRTINPIVGGSIRNVFVKIPQTFHKIDVPSLEQSFDLRFKYFINEILPQFKGPSMAHCMIYVPSYFDYVRLRNYFKAETINFVQICEYTKDKKIARARDMFFHSGAHFLLYSERAHFFRRTRIKGIRHLIMYQPPCWPNLYPELINLMQEANQNARDGLETSMSITVLYTKYDTLQISSIIGTDRATKLFQSIKKINVLSNAE